MTVHEPNVSVELITPAKAEEYLARNTHNRPLRQHTLNAYTRDITNGDWRWNGEGIKFDVDGVLLDGQHRLAAIVKAGKPVRMLVIRDLPTEVQETMDVGAKRKFSDMLALRGEHNYTTLAATVRSITVWEASGPGTTGGERAVVTSAELSRTLEKYPWLREGCTVINRAATGAGLPVTLGGVLWWLFMQLDAEDAYYFFERLGSDQDHHIGEPIYALRRLLAESRESVRKNRSRRYTLAVSIKAWNKYRDGESCDLLRFRVGGAAPEKFPEAI